MTPSLQHPSAWSISLWRPDPEQLESFPEIALLAVLQHALDVAVNGLLAAYPYIGEDRCDPRCPESQAEAIVPIAYALADAITRYRVAIDRSWVTFDHREDDPPADAPEPDPADHSDDDGRS